MKRTPILLFLVIAVIYLTAPIIAGVQRVGSRDGPAFYPVELHTFLFRIGYDESIDGKPRILHYRCGLYKRPWFWGGEFRPRPAPERQVFVERMIKEMGLDRAKSIIDENDNINQKVC